MHAVPVTSEVVFAFDLTTLDLPAAAVQLPTGFTVETVAAVPAADRPATYRLESLWAMERGWVDEPRPWTPDLDLHLVEDYASLEQGFTLLARDDSGRVVGMHGAHRHTDGSTSTHYLVVEPDLRGRGLGRALKGWQLRIAQQLGWPALVCDVPADAAAAGVRAMNAALGGRRV